MIKNTFILSLAVLFLASACSLPGNNDLNTPDERQKDSRNYQYLKGVYDKVRGEYPLEIYVDGKPTRRCVVLNVDYKIIEDRKNSLGQPVYTANLYGKFTDFESQINDANLTGLLNEDNGDISFILNDKTQVIEVLGQLQGGQLTGTLRIEGYPAGDLRAEVRSSNNCPSQSKLAKEYISKIESTFAGTWSGNAETSSVISGHRIQLGIFVTKMTTPDGGFSFDITSNFDREPFGNQQAVNVSLGLNQNPYTLNFAGPSVKFYGDMVAPDLIKGTIIYPRGSMKVVLKRRH